MVTSRQEKAGSKKKEEEYRLLELRLAWTAAAEFTWTIAGQAIAADDATTSKTCSSDAAAVGTAAAAAMEPAPNESRDN